MSKKFVKEVTSQKKDFSRWYMDVILKAGLIDYAPVKGCMIIKPYGYAIWEQIQEILGGMIKDTGHENAYFPLFIPENLLQKEVDHVEGFAPEVAWVTHGGESELGERLAVRPTSETIVCSMLSDWVQSHRDLPVLLNQWANVVRWEKSTRPFLRTTEFLWQEGHTAHSTQEEAQKETLKMLGVYAHFVEKYLAIPVVQGQKTEKEKFAGAEATYSIEALMKDGKGLQAGTSHNLGQHFARVFDIQYSNDQGSLEYVHQTSWGVSTRLIGGLIMAHGDDRGLKIPPQIAPIQVVIVPIRLDKSEEVQRKVEELNRELDSAGFRVKVDDRDQYRPGWKFNEWEMKGVPLRIEIGPRDVKKGELIAARRDTQEKITVKIEDAGEQIRQLLQQIQSNIFKQAQKFVEINTATATDLEEMNQILDNQAGYIKAMWCGSQECEEKVKDQTKATIRNIPFNQEKVGKSCVCCGQRAEQMVYFARAY
mgnify:FL=1